MEFEGVFGVVAKGLASRPEAVSGFGVVVDGLNRLPLGVVAEHDELRLHTRIKRVSGFGCLLHGPLQRHARADIVGRIVVEEVGEDDRDFRIPRADENRVEIRNWNLIWIGRAELGEHRHGVHRKLRTIADAQPLEL